MEIRKIWPWLSLSLLLGCGPSAVSIQGLNSSRPDTPSRTSEGTDPGAPLVPAQVPTQSHSDRLENVLLDPVNEIPEDAARNAYAYFRANADSISNKKYMTIIDFTASSRTKRMHLVNVQTGAVERYLVAHGKNSGFDFPTQFSNRNGSNMSSIGFYLTGSQYSGGHGISMHLHGQESTNSNAFDRAIVVHGASYVTDEIAATQPRLGRSLGCPAVDMQYISSIVHRLEDGSLYYIYYAKKALGLESIAEGLARPDLLGLHIPGEEVDETLKDAASGE